MEVISYLIWLSVLGALYFLPSIVGRKKKDFAAIFVVNLFLGWTLVGWVVALAWGIKHDFHEEKSVQVNIQTTNKEKDEAD